MFSYALYRPAFFSQVAVQSGGSHMDQRGANGCFDFQFLSQGFQKDKPLGNVL
jgi:hypothetical protein